MAAAPLAEQHQQVVEFSQPAQNVVPEVELQQVVVPKRVVAPQVELHWDRVEYQLAPVQKRVVLQTEFPQEDLSRCYRGGGKFLAATHLVKVETPL